MTGTQDQTYESGPLHPRRGLRLLGLAVIGLIVTNVTVVLATLAQL